MLYNSIDVKVKKIGPKAHKAILPTYASDGAGAFDIYSVNQVLLSRACSTAIVSTGLSFEIPPGYTMLMFSRSGLAFKSGVRLATCVSVIDSDYRGELLVKLTIDLPSAIGSGAFSHPPGQPGIEVILPEGSRVAQGIILPIPKVVFSEVDNLTETARGENGLGSTGV